MLLVFMPPPLLDGAEGAIFIIVIILFVSMSTEEVMFFGLSVSKIAQKVMDAFL